MVGSEAPANQTPRLVRGSSGECTWLFPAFHMDPTPSLPDGNATFCCFLAGSWLCFELSVWKQLVTFGCTAVEDMGALPASHFKTHWLEPVAPAPPPPPPPWPLDLLSVPRTCRACGFQAQIKVRQTLGGQTLGAASALCGTRRVPGAGEGGDGSDHRAGNGAKGGVQLGHLRR